jgi:hypothetical protein
LQVNGITNVLKKDIYNIKSIFFKNETSKEMYVFILHLQEKGYFVRFTVDSENRICSVFFTHEEAIKETRTMPESIVVDATYKTNTHKLTFVNIAGTSNVTSTSSGRGSLQIFPVASAWVNNELEATYTWVFQQLKESILPTTEHGCSETFVMDNDKSVHNAIKAVFPLSGCLLCFVHMQRNFVTNIGGTFTPDSSAHRSVLELQLEEAFKKIAFCKTEEEMSKSIAEFEPFLKIPEYCKDGGIKGIDCLRA